MNSDKALVLVVDGTENIQTFKKWGTSFNEFGWDALNMLTIE